MSFLILNSGNTALGHTLMTVISFIVLLLIIRKVAWVPLLNILEERSKKIHDDITKAESEKADSSEANRLAQEELRKAKAQASQIILQAKKQSVLIQDSMLNEAKVEVERLHETSKREIELERRRIMHEMRDEITSISIEMAEKVLNREIKEADHRRLVDDFIQRMDDL
ncbi:F0F1 ATP synthase subunit B [Fundicoccus sp. Sow4_D5]|uniref:F0F1 ATP synthase subunit B n=1 Tax=unclassified Fundicoccus TaxID=2761543 RepID=UPI003F8DBC3C